MTCDFPAVLEIGRLGTVINQLLAFQHLVILLTGQLRGSQQTSPGRGPRSGDSGSGDLSFPWSKAGGHASG